LARQFQSGRGQRLANWYVATLVRLGIGYRSMYLLTVKGRKSGRAYTTRVTLRRGGRSEEASVTELDAATAAPVLRKYVTAVPITRPYFDVTPESPVEDYVVEAPRHPVFALS